MALNRSERKSKTVLFAEYVLNQKNLSFDILYGSQRFENISENSKRAGKDNKPFLNQDVFTTMKEGTKITDDIFLDVFQRVGDCDEKPKW